MSSGVGQRLNDFQLLDDRARPAVRDDKRQCILMLRTNVNEMDIKAVDLSDELWQRIEAAPRPCASRIPSPNSARAFPSSRAGRLAMNR